jgi:hypothetical protein
MLAANPANSNRFILFNCYSLFRDSLATIKPQKLLVVAGLFCSSVDGILV